VNTIATKWVQTEVGTLYIRAEAIAAHVARGDCQHHFNPLNLITILITSLITVGTVTGFLILFIMSDQEADRKKAMAAVRATFERYKLIADRRPKDHIVSKPENQLLPTRVTNWRTSIVRS
jgi:hypothetical protein